LKFKNNLYQICCHQHFKYRYLFVLPKFYTRSTNKYTLIIIKKINITVQFISFNFSKQAVKNNVEHYFSKQAVKNNVLLAMRKDQFYLKKRRNCCFYWFLEINIL